MNPRQQGDIGEASAIQWFTNRGVTIATPFGHSPDWDLIVQWHGRLDRVQVKTSNCRHRSGNWAVAICTRGGNQSWSGLVRRFSANRCDYLFAHVGDGRRWLVPASAVEAGNAITLGGPKYSEYEIESGAELPARRPVDRAA